MEAHASMTRTGFPPGPAVMRRNANFLVSRRGSPKAIECSRRMSPRGARPEFPEGLLFLSMMRWPSSGLNFHPPQLRLTASLGVRCFHDHRMTAEVSESPREKPLAIKALTCLKLTREERVLSRASRLSSSSTSDRKRAGSMALGTSSIC